MTMYVWCALIDVYVYTTGDQRGQPPTELKTNQRETNRSKPMYTSANQPIKAKQSNAE